MNKIVIASVIFLLSTFGNSASALISCTRDVSDLQTLDAKSVGGYIAQCIKFGPLSQFEDDLGLRFEVETKTSGDNSFTYYKEGSSTQYSTKSFENSNGAFRYYRKGSSDSQTFVSIKGFENSNGQFIYFRDQKDDDNKTFLSTKEFSNDNGDFLYLRKQKDDDSKTFFSLKRFENDNGSFVYFREANSDDKTFLSIKEFENSNGKFVYFRVGKDDDGKTFLSIKNDTIYRDKNKKQISRKQFIEAFVEQFWTPVMKKGPNQIFAAIGSRLPQLGPPQE